MRDESGLTNTEEFQRLAKGLDLKGNHFFFASEQIGKTIAPIIEAAMEATATFLSNAANTCPAGAY